MSAEFQESGAGSVFSFGLVLRESGFYRNEELPFVSPSVVTRGRSEDIDWAERTLGRSRETMSTPNNADAFTVERHGDLFLYVANPALETIDAGLESQVAEVILAPLSRIKGPLVVFDLAAVNYFGSMFLTLLIRCWKLTNSKGGMMALAGVSPQAKELLHMTSLDMLWPMYTTRREAMEALLSD